MASGLHCYIIYNLYWRPERPLEFSPVGQGGFALGLWGFALGPRGFSDTNMLVLATRKSHVGGLPNAGTQHEGVCVAVEYRL